MTDFDIEVLRLGHRMGRDPRITTHLALVSRAMGAKKFVLAGDEDDKLLLTQVVFSSFNVLLDVSVVNIE